MGHSPKPVCSLRSVCDSGRFWPSRKAGRVSPKVCWPKDRLRAYLQCGMVGVKEILTLQSSSSTCTFSSCRKSRRTMSGHCSKAQTFVFPR